MSELGLYGGYGGSRETGAFRESHSSGQSAEQASRTTQGREGGREREARETPSVRDTANLQTRSLSYSVST